jgi:pimeloyl-ACP methyl ester carboxylesterase
MGEPTRRKRKTRRGGAGRTLLAGTLAAALGVATVAAIRSARRSLRVARALPPRELAARFGEKAALVGDIRMRWLEHGQGQPVVFVHGIPTSPELWRRVLPRLRGARALAWEMVGYGKSIPEGKGRDLSVAKQADYLAAWLRQLGVERAVLVGHDLGGGVVQIAATRYPGLCVGLLLTNAVGYDSWPIPEVKAIRAAGDVVGHLPNPAIKLVHSTLFQLGHDNPEIAREASACHWRNYARHGAAAAFVRQVRSLDVRDTLAVQDALPHLGVPARVVWGAADQFQRVRYGERFARDLGTTLRRIEGGKHFTPEDHPDVIAEALNDLILEVQAEAART